MKKDNFVVRDTFDTHAFTQTDFGRLVYNTPAEVLSPTSIDELARILADCNTRGEAVTVRNAGHSSNGQTLTSGTQVSLAQLTGITVDEAGMKVTAHAGDTWDDLYEAIDITKYCIPVNTNNPGQKIHVGGTVSVSGIGAMATKHGYVYDYVAEIAVVTMEGEVLMCNKETNKELFSYAVAGYGRVGVIASVTLRLMPAYTYVASVGLCYLSREAFYHDLEKTLREQHFDGVEGTRAFFNAPISRVFAGVKVYYLELFTFTNDEHEAANIARKVKKEYRHTLQISTRINKHSRISLTRGPTLGTYKDFLYYYPYEHHMDQVHGFHVWADYACNEKSYRKFYEDLCQKVEDEDMVRCLPSQSLHKWLAIHFMPLGVSKKKDQDNTFPLGLAAKGDPYIYDVGVMFQVPLKDVPRARRIHDEVVEACLSSDGSVYLYGYHALSEEQICMQYGQDIITKWNALKMKHDPKGLLNKDVIEHIDEM